jgi:CRISPR system Cascade subunit CasD
MPGEKNLALYLDAPLQSWGYGSKFDRRTSLGYPTRSGVLGMICAALGVDRDDVEGLRRLDHVSMTVLCFGGGARLVDFHTVGGGYDRKAEKQHIVRTADDKTGGTVVTRREYLQDARFGVVLRGDARFLEEIESALLDPRWGIWLGRKSCVPASPICQGLFDSEEAAEEHLCGVDRPKLTHPEGPRPRRYTEVATFDEGTDTIMDRPLDFAGRRFAPRRVAEE